MAAETYTDTLAWFKEHEKPETVLFIADDADRLKLAVAWTNLSITTTEEVPAPDDATEADRWEWLWTNVSFSKNELIAKSSGHEGGFEKRMKALVGNRVLYPDGTLNSFAHKYIREQVLKLFSTTAKKKSKA